VMSSRLCKKLEDAIFSVEIEPHPPYAAFKNPADCGGWLEHRSRNLSNALLSPHPTVLGEWLEFLNLHTSSRAEPK
jgi:hypothetical protein